MHVPDDDFTGLFERMGVAANANPEPTEPPVPPTAPDPTTVEGGAAPEGHPDPKGSPGEPVLPTEPEPTEPAKSEPPKEDKQAKAFAEMRAKNTQYERLIKMAAEAEGVSVDEYLKKFETESLTKRATKMNTDPAILQRLEEAEMRLASYEQQNIQAHLQTEFGRIRSTLGVSENELQEFTASLVAQGFDFTNTNIDYVELYRGKNYAKLVEKERQAWITRDQRAQQQGTQPLPRGRGTSDVTTEVNSPEDMVALLRQMK